MSYVDVLAAKADDQAVERLCSSPELELPGVGPMHSGPSCRELLKNWLTGRAVIRSAGNGTSSRSSVSRSCCSDRVRAYWL
jgi:hypothetical protein